MVNVVIWVSLLLCICNWVLFLTITIRQVSSTANESQITPPPSLDKTEAQALNPAELTKEAGALAIAFNKAGAASTAAAMSMICLLFALIAIGVDKI